MKNNIIVRAGGIILNKSGSHIILVLNRLSYLKNENKWGLPKGHLKENEMPHVGAQREIFEETGIKFKIQDTTDFIKIYDTVYYIVHLEENDISQNPLTPRDKNEISKAEWFSFEDLKELNVNRGLSHIIKDVTRLTDFLDRKRYSKSWQIIV